MTRQDAIDALRAIGIRNASEQLISDWMRVQQAQDWALEVPSLSPDSAGSANPTPPRPSSSRSNLKPVLRVSGQLEQPRGPRKRGRPAVIASWFPKLALIMSDGTPLREALSRLGIDGVTPRLLRSLYRNTVLSRLRSEARHKWQSEYGVRVRPRSKGLRQLLRSL